MNTKIIIAAFFVAIVLAAVGFFINMPNLFPAPVTLFVAALLGGCLTSYWVCSAEGLTTDTTPGSARRSRSRGGRSRAKESREPRESRAPRETRAPRESGATPAQSAAASTSALDKELGNVKWFSASKGFGFITRDTGEDIFVHFRSIMGNGHRILREGQRVEFAVTEGTKGLQAEEVSAIKS